MLYTDKIIDRLCTQIREIINLSAAHWPIFVTASAAGEMEPLGMHGTLDDLCDRLNLPLAPYEISLSPIPRDEDEPDGDSHLLAMHCATTNEVAVAGRWVPCTYQSPAVVLETLREHTVETVLDLISNQTNPEAQRGAAEVAEVAA